MVSLSPRFSGLQFVTGLLRSFSVLRHIVSGSEMIWLVSLVLGHPSCSSLLWNEWGLSTRLRSFVEMNVVVSISTSSFTPISQMFDLLHLGGTAPCPALHHLGWPWLGVPLLRWLTVQLTTIEVGPGLNTFLFFPPSPLASPLFSSLAAPPAKMKPNRESHSGLPVTPEIS